MHPLLARSSLRSGRSCVGLLFCFFLTPISFFMSNHLTACSHVGCRLMLFDICGDRLHNYEKELHKVYTETQHHPTMTRWDERFTFLGSRYGKGVPFSGWSYVKRGTFSEKVMWKGYLFRERYVKGCQFSKFNMWKGPDFPKISMWKGPDFPKFSMWKDKGSGPRAEHPRMKSVGALSPGTRCGRVIGKIIWWKECIYKNRRKKEITCFNEKDNLF